MVWYSLKWIKVDKYNKNCSSQYCIRKIMKQPKSKKDIEIPVLHIFIHIQKIQTY